MGIGKSNAVNITLSRSSSFYYAGEKVTGYVSFHNKHKNFKINNVFLEFIGEFGYTTKHKYHIQDSIGHSQPEHRTVYHQLPFIRIRCPLIDRERNEVNIYIESK